MAPTTTKPADTIDKRRPHIILQTLTPLVSNTPTNTVTVRFTMSTPSLKSDPPRSSFSDSSSARLSFQSSVSAQTREPVGDGKSSPALSAVGTGVLARAELETAKDELRAEMKVHADRLEAKIDTRIQDLEVKMDAKIDHLRETILPQQIIHIDARIDDLEKHMQDNFQRVDARADNMEKYMQENFQAMQNRMQQMQDSIDLILRVLSERQPADPRMQLPAIHVQHSPDAPTGVAHSPISPDSASDASLRGAAGPSSPQALAGDDGISLSPSDHREITGIFRNIRRVASRGSDIMKKVKGMGSSRLPQP
ncbi:hypothetical protein C8Q80DRAFT_823370 [Daedaleopsis nitida]|nr:hypothetical protein C8Q80DRAFT_823370 [Daedaleopsis nitida]